MNFRAKSIIKKVALILAGITAVTAAGFGVKALVDYTKDDLKTITPTFEVGNLGSDGKFVDNESTLYTKKAFEAEGLQIKLDFDSQINYQIFFYDDLDNFVESTAVLSTAYSETVHDGYARIVITPTDDEDEKISLVERITYPGQMEIKVNKKQDAQYYNVLNKRLMEVNNVSQLRFDYGTIATSNGYHFDDNTYFAVTSKDILNVNGIKSISCNIPTTYTDSFFTVYQLSYDDRSGDFNVIEASILNSSVVLESNVDFVLFTFVMDDTANTSIPDGLMPMLSSFLILNK